MQGIWQTVKSVFSRFFGSRKMTLGIVGMGVIVVSNLAPELSPRAEQIGNLIFALVGLVSGTIMLEDSLKAWASRPRTLGEGWNMAREGLTTKTASNTVPTKSAPPSGKTDTQILPKIDPPSMEGVNG